VFTLVCLIPLAWVTYRLLTGDLGANPAEHVNHKMGLIALRLLAVNLVWGSVIALGWMPRPLLKYGYLRRHLGVVMFAYLSLHFVFYFLREGDLAVASQQLFTKTYLIVGLVAWAVLLVLTVTSADWAVRKLRARWKTVHRLVYPALALGVIHFQLIEKKDWTEAWPYLAPVVLLYVIRLARVARGPRPRRAT
jgi:sulfoxide reductase heme-binding subunit YedZ